MIDVHAHINDKKLIDNVINIVQNAKINGITKIICVGDDLESSKKAIALSEQFPEVYAAIGVHPERIQCFDSTVEEFLSLNSKHKKVVAVGEIGLDYHMDNPDKEKQTEIFIRQLKIAYEQKLPVQIHSRDATGDMMDILRSNQHLLKFGGIMHCFNGSEETLNEIIKLGLCVSVGGIVTFKNATNVQEIVSKMPLKIITLETDCPYLTPHPHRGETNEPKFIELTCEKIAQIKKVLPSEIDKITTNNAERIFPKLLNIEYLR